MTKLQQALTITFGLEPREIRVTGLSFLHSFLIGVPRLFSYTAASALFFEHFTAEDLPYVYLLSSLLVPLVGVFYLFWERRVSIHRLLLGTSLALVVILIAFRSILQAGSMSVVAIALLTWYEVEWAMTNLVFWSTTHRLFTARQGKRLFGLIGTGEVLAIIIGGFFSPVLVAWMGPTNLLWLSIGSLLLATLTLSIILRSFSTSFAGDPEGTSSQEPTSGTSVSVEGRPKRGYVSLIFGIVALSYVSFYVVDNAFYKVAVQRYPSGEELAAFLGVLFASLGVLNLLIGGFVCRRWTARFGLLGGLLGAPLLVATFAVVLIVTALATDNVTLVFALFVVLKAVERNGHTLSSPSYYVLYQPLPSKVRGRVQGLADTVVCQIGAGIAAFLLLVLNKVFSVSALTLVIVLLAFVAAWIAVAVLAKRGYVTSLNEALSRRELKGIDVALHGPEASAILARGVRSPRVEEVCYCLDLMAEANHPLLESTVMELTGHSDAQVRISAYSQVERLRIVESVAALRERVSLERDPDGHASLLRSLAAVEGDDAFDVLEPFLRSESPSRRRGAIVGLLRYGGLEGAACAESHLLELLQSEEADQRIMAACLLGEVGESTFSRHLLPLLRDDEVSVRLAAVEAGRKSGNEDLWPAVIEQLADPLIRSAAMGALRSGSHGVPALLRALEQPDQGPSMRIRIVEILGHIGGSEVEESLFSALHAAEPDLRRALLNALGRLAFNAPPSQLPFVQDLLVRETVLGIELMRCRMDVEAHSSCSLLVAALAHELYKARERTMLILSLLYPADRVMTVWANFSNPSARKKDFAVELLDDLLTHDHKRWLLPFYDSMDDRVCLDKLADLSAPEGLSLEQRLAQLISEKGPSVGTWVRICAIDACWRGRLDVCRSSVESSTRSTNRFLATFARGVLARWSSLRPDPVTPDLISRVERLRSLPIFAACPDERLAEVAAHLELVQADPDEPIFEKGSPGTSLYIVIEGRVRVHEEDRTLRTLEVGDFFGEMAALSPVRRSASVTALEPSRFLTLSQLVLHSLIRDHRDVAKAISLVLCRRLRESDVATNALAVSPDAPPDEPYHSDSPQESSLLHRIIILKSLDIFSKIPDRVLAEVASLTDVVALSSAQNLFEEGDVGTTMYVITCGRVRVHRGDRTLAELGEHEIIGELASLASEPRSASVTAIAPTTLLALDQDSLYALIGQHPEVLEGIMRVLVQRVIEIGTALSLPLDSEA